MKVLKELKVKTKDELYQTIRESKVLPFFHVFQRMIKYNVINYYIYLIILFIEYIQLFCELLNDGIDYISTSDQQIKNSSSYYVFYVLQYINFQSFINKEHLSYHSFIIIYSIIVTILVLNFASLIVVDYVDRKNKNSNNKHTLHITHVILGIFNILNVKILLIPIHYIFLESFKLNHYTDKETGYNKVGVRIITVIVFILNMYIVIKTALLYNNVNPIKNKISWGESYPQIEIYNIMLKIVLTLFNVIKGKFLFGKSVITLFVNVIRCHYRYDEWYYAWKVNKILLNILDFSFFMFNFLKFANNKKDDIDLLLIYVFISFLFGIVIFFILSHIKAKIIEKKITRFTKERDFCELIMHLLEMIEGMQDENKSMKDEIFFGFLTNHDKTCTNPHCTSKTIKQLITTSETKFSNEIDTFTISKNEFCSYCKTDKNDNFEFLQDLTKNRCEKLLYYLIKCIIDTGIRYLPKKKVKFLPLLEAYIYIHIFSNNFYSLFEIMTYYSSSSGYREKFFFFVAMTDIMELMTNENNLKYTSSATLTFATDYYFYIEKFINNLKTVLRIAHDIFDKLNVMQPNAKEILIPSVELGIDIKNLHKHFNTIMTMNPYEINILRIYSFVIDKLYNMKTLSHQNIIRLQQNIKYFLMNDKFNTKENDSKFSIKNFHENSDSGVLIVSGLLDNIGDILYSNDIIKAIFGYEKNEIVGCGLNLIIPQPLAAVHNEIILNFYKKGERNVIDKLVNRFGLHKNGTLVSISDYVLLLPNLEYGIMFISFVKKEFVFSLSNHKNETVINNKAKIDKTVIQRVLTKQNTYKSSPSVSVNEATTDRKKMSLVNMTYKVSDTGVMILNENFDILHMNMFSLVNFFGLNKAFAPGKINIKKICKEFQSKFDLLESGETCSMIIDTESVVSKMNENVIMRSNTTNLYGSVCSFNLDDNSNNALSPALSSNRKSINNFVVKPRNVKVSLAMNQFYTKKGIKEKYYIVVIQNNNVKDNSTNSNEEDKSDDDIDSDFDSINDSDNNESSLKQINIDSAVQKKNSKSKYISLNETIKKKLLTDTYISNFTRAANITLYTLLLLIVIWLCVSYGIELNRLSSLKTHLSIYNTNEKIINVISNYVIELFLVMRTNFFPLANVRQIQPILTEMMKVEEESMYNLVRYNYKESADNRLNSDKITFSTITEKGEKNKIDLTLEIAIEKLIFYSTYIKNSENYKDMTVDNFFDVNFVNRLRAKTHYVFNNYYDAFYDNVGANSFVIVSDLFSRIKSTKHSMIIIFTISIVFCVVVSFLFVVALLNQEQRKKDYLIFLAERNDAFYADKINLISLFDKNVDILIEEDHNVHKIKNQLDKDDDFKSDFVSSDVFLNRISEDVFTELLLKANTYRKNMSISTTLISNNNLKKISRQSSLMNIPRNLSHKSNTSLKYIRKSTNNYCDDKKISFCDYQFFKTKTLNSKKESTLIDNDINNSSNNTVSDATEIDSINHEKEILKENFDIKPSISTSSRLKLSIDSTSNFKRRTNRQRTSMPSYRSPFMNIIPKQKYSKNEIISALLPKTNPNLVTRNSNRPSPLLTKKSIFTSTNNDENIPLNSANKIEGLSSSSSSEEIERSFTRYKIPYKRALITFGLAAIYLSSFFIASIAFLLSYTPSLSDIVEVLAMLYNRDKTINNLIITMNLNLMSGLRMNISEQNDVGALTVSIQNIENEYKNILTKIKKHKDTYELVLSYEDGNLCESFSKFNTSYNILQCEHFLSGNGISFKISEIVQYVYEMYLSVYYRSLNDTLSIEYLEQHFNDPIFIDLIIENTFLLRLFRNDIVMTYIDDYIKYIKMIEIGIHVKFAVYFVMMIISVVFYQLCFLPSIIEIINNLTRVKLFF